MQKYNVLCISDPPTHLPTAPTVEIYNYLSRDPRFNLFHITPQLFIQMQSIAGMPVRDLVRFEEYCALTECPVNRLEKPPFDIVFTRVGKPYPENFMETLEKFENDFEFVNKPSGVAVAEKRSFYHEHCQDFLSPSLYSRDEQAIVSFMREHKRIVVKKEHSYGGMGLAFITPEDFKLKMEISDNRTMSFNSESEAIRFLLQDNPNWISFNKFLAGASNGDKRVIVIEGKIITQFLRKSTGTSLTHNMTAGAQVFPCDLSTEESICIENTYRKYLELGVRILGYDFLQDENGKWVLSEINCGNVGGFRATKDLYNIDGVQILIDWLFQLAEKSIHPLSPSQRV